MSTLSQSTNYCLPLPGFDGTVGLIMFKFVKETLIPGDVYASVDD